MCRGLILATDELLALVGLYGSRRKSGPLRFPATGDQPPRCFFRCVMKETDEIGVSRVDATPPLLADFPKTGPATGGAGKNNELVIYDTGARLLTRYIKPGASLGATQHAMLRDPRHPLTAPFVKFHVAERTRPCGVSIHY